MFLKSMIVSQHRMQELMSEEDDYIIYDGTHAKENVDMTCMCNSFTGVEHYTVKDKQSARFFEMTKVNWSEVKKTGEY